MRSFGSRNGETARLPSTVTFSSSMRELALVVSFFSLALTSTGCGEKDTLKAFDVEMIVQSDCRQVGQGAVQCEDEGDLAIIQTLGRWIVDERDGGSFLLNTHDGRVLPGILFENDGQVATTNSCLGDGGKCYFARTEEASYDVENACEQIEQHIIDAVLDSDGNLNGLMINVTFTAEGCVNSLITERRIEFSGVPSDEVVAARKEFE